VGNRGHELVEHTADEGLHVWAPTLEELFAEAALGLIRVMGTAQGRAASERVSIDAPDRDALFVDWLSEVLFLFEAREVVPHDVRVEIDRDPWRLRATIDGVQAETFEQEGPAVKAVTYHGLQMSDTEATVYLDV
jgi:SHS2 domain-containing protein